MSDNQFDWPHRQWPKTQRAHTHTPNEKLHEIIYKGVSMLLLSAVRCPLNVWLGIYIARIDATGSSIQNRYVRLRAIRLTFVEQILLCKIHVERKAREKEKNRPNNK